MKLKTQIEFSDFDDLDIMIRRIIAKATIWTRLSPTECEKHIGEDRIQTKAKGKYFILQINNKTVPGRPFRTEISAKSASNNLWAYWIKDKYRYLIHKKNHQRAVEKTKLIRYQTELFNSLASA